jgi:hypothetical protein
MQALNKYTPQKYSAAEQWSLLLVNHPGFKTHPSINNQQQQRKKENGTE